MHPSLTYTHRAEETSLIGSHREEYWRRGFQHCTGEETTAQVDRTHGLLSDLILRKGNGPTLPEPEEMREECSKLREGKCRNAIRLEEREEKEHEVQRGNPAPCDEAGCQEMVLEVGHGNAHHRETSRNVHGTEVIWKAMRNSGLECEPK
ncbi:hypothetical protein R1flu_011847 [Riccia fluitans]|uniref:Uncharacterized protein n=1 Tax=Riccia fluitans TaxID=41844 RepID=A0ABD1Z960_9MARC